MIAPDREIGKGFVSGKFIDPDEELHTRRSMVRQFGPPESRVR
jgi:hypothetical protein